MLKTLKLLALSTALTFPTVLLSAQPCLAAIPPLSNERRAEQSTVIITATVLETTTHKVGVDMGGYDLLTTAKVRVESVEKGDLKVGQTVEVHYRKTGKRPRGWAGPQGQNQNLTDGSVVRLFLDQSFGAYHLLKPNGWEPVQP
jgi:hypothetical protein